MHEENDSQLVDGQCKRKTPSCVTIGQAKENSS